ncbi:ubiquinone/menaquinone biosynthesis methyltransferase [Corynebacterium felinum]|nr:ubiquinone/menaquinone biosynthesis methyltransferase [Corynebacterium felinum]
MIVSTKNFAPDRSRPPEQSHTTQPTDPQPCIRTETRTESARNVATHADFAASQANRSYWDEDADNYHKQHPDYLSSFYWCPEMLHESSAQLLGDVTNLNVLEIGAGSAPCSTWLQEQYPTATVVAFDISAGMLSKAKRACALVQADALALPFAPHSFDCVFSAFGAIPFIEDLPRLFATIADVLHPGGRFVYAVNHPMRWVFLDDPGELGLQAAVSYFERRYIEHDEDGKISYAEFQHTMGDHIEALHSAGFHLERLIEPEWPETLTQTWGQWSPLRGKIFPGTAIFCATLT